MTDLTHFEEKEVGPNATQYAKDYSQGYNDCLSQTNAKELYEALKRLVELHSAEQEGISAGMPTPRQWYEAVEKAADAIEKSTEKPQP